MINNLISRLSCQRICHIPVYPPNFFINLARKRNNSTSKHSNIHHVFSHDEMPADAINRKVLLMSSISYPLDFGKGFNTVITKTTKIRSITIKDITPTVSYSFDETQAS